MPTTIQLWEGSAPLAMGDEPEDVPTLTLYQPAEAVRSGAAMVICPGGGYEHLAQHEGETVGEWLAGLGVLAGVLKYRLGPRYRHPAMLNDVSRAVRLVRARAAAWKVDPTRVGVMGFSAG